MGWREKRVEHGKISRYHRKNEESILSCLKAATPSAGDPGAAEKEIHTQ
jgi:hypothetical protein